MGSAEWARSLAGHPHWQQWRPGSVHLAVAAWQWWPGSGGRIRVLMAPVHEVHVLLVLITHSSHQPALLRTKLSHPPS